VLKYAVCGVVLCAVICGTYYLGYSAGSNKRQIEYVTKEVEVVRYVNKKKSDIYSKPNANRDALLKLMHDNKL
jgi:hypothetical protein